MRITPGGAAGATNTKCHTPTPLGYRPRPTPRFTSPAASALAAGTPPAHALEPVPPPRGDSFLPPLPTHETPSPPSPGVEQGEDGSSDAR
ncbi:hypothetical protein GCM10027168_74830 [Streptomyces capparidis]